MVVDEFKLIVLHAPSVKTSEPPPLLVMVTLPKGVAADETNFHFNEPEESTSTAVREIPAVGHAVGALSSSIVSGIDTLPC